MADVSLSSLVVALTITASAMGGPGNPRDFVGLYRPGAPDGSFLAWEYLNNEQIPPPVGLSSGSMTFGLPSATGNYELRFMSVTGQNPKIFTLLAKSPTVYVTEASPVSMTLTPASVTLLDNAPAGTLVTTAQVVTSDGSAFAGPLVLDNTDKFAVKGLQIITARNLSATDDGATILNVTAMQGLGLVQIGLPVAVSTSP